MRLKKNCLDHFNLLYWLIGKDPKVHLRKDGWAFDYYKSYQFELGFITIIIDFTYVVEETLQLCKAGGTLATQNVVFIVESTDLDCDLLPQSRTSLFGRGYTLWQNWSNLCKAHCSVLARKVWYICPCYCPHHKIDRTCRIEPKSCHTSNGVHNTFLDFRPLHDQVKTLIILIQLCCSSSRHMRFTT